MGVNDSTYELEYVIGNGPTDVEYFHTLSVANTLFTHLVNDSRTIRVELRHRKSKAIIKSWEKK